MLAVGVGATVILADPAIALFSTLGGGTAGNFIGGALFGEGSDGQKWFMLLGGLVGGAAGGKGGVRYDTWRTARYRRDISKNMLRALKMAHQEL